MEDRKSRPQKANMVKAKTGKALKEFRKSHGLTQKEFADIAGVTAKTVSLWEQGHSFPRMSNLEAVAERYGISVQEIYLPFAHNVAFQGRHDMKSLLNDMDDSRHWGVHIVSQSPQPTRIGRSPSSFDAMKLVDHYRSISYATGMPLEIILIAMETARQVYSYCAPEEEVNTNE